MANEELRVEIIQEFEDGTPDLQEPSLRTVLIGDHYQIETDKTLGTFSGSAVSPSYPSLIVGAEVDTASVVVSVVDSEGTFELNNTTEAVAGASSIAISATGAGTPALPGTGLMRRALQRAASGTGASISGVVLAGVPNFSDPNVNYITSGVVAGDQLVIAAPSSNAGIYYVKIISANTLELYDDTALTTKSSLTADTSDDSYVIVNDYAISGTMIVSYSARRSDLVGSLRLINRQQEIEAIAGPAVSGNPLGLAANIYNTAAPGTAFYVTALSEDTAAGHAAALDVLEGESVYVLVPLHQNDSDLDLATLYSQHVTSESLPENGKFRLALVSKTVPSQLTRVASTSLLVVNGDFDVGAGANEMDLTDANGDFLADGVVPGDLLTISGSDIIAHNTTWLVKSVTSTVITVVGTSTGPNTTTLTYSVTSQPFTLTDQAEYMKAYAESIANRRMVNLVAGRGEIKTSFTGDEWVPAFYANASIAGLISFLPPQQGISRMSVPAITEIRSPVAGKFRRDDLNTIGSGGNFIIEKPTEGALVRVRRQRTTSTFLACEAELSCNKAVDYASFYIAGALEPFLGVTNVVDSFFNIAQATLDTVRHNLTSGALPGIGPVLTGMRIVSFKPGVEAGTVELIIDVTVPFPVNVIRVRIIV